MADLYTIVCLVAAYIPFELSPYEIQIVTVQPPLRTLQEM